MEAGAGIGGADLARVISVYEAWSLMMRLVCIRLGLPKRSRLPVRSAQRSSQAARA